MPSENSNIAIHAEMHKLTFEQSVDYFSTLDRKSEEYFRLLRDLDSYRSDKGSVQKGKFAAKFSFQPGPTSVSDINKAIREFKAPFMPIAPQHVKQQGTAIVLPLEIRENKTKSKTSEVLFCPSIMWIMKPPSAVITTNLGISLLLASRAKSIDFSMVKDYYEDIKLWCYSNGNVRVMMQAAARNLNTLVQPGTFSMEHILRTMLVRDTSHVAKFSYDDALCYDGWYSINAKASGGTQTSTCTVVTPERMLQGRDRARNIIAAASGMRSAQLKVFANSLFSDVSVCGVVLSSKKDVYKIPEEGKILAGRVYYCPSTVFKFLVGPLLKHYSDNVSIRLVENSQASSLYGFSWVGLKSGAGVFRELLASALPGTSFYGGGGDDLVVFGVMMDGRCFIIMPDISAMDNSCHIDHIDTVIGLIMQHFTGNKAAMMVLNLWKNMMTGPYVVTLKGLCYNKVFGITTGMPGVTLVEQNIIAGLLGKFADQRQVKRPFDEVKDEQHLVLVKEQYFDMLAAHGYNVKRPTLLDPTKKDTTVHQVFLVSDMFVPGFQFSETVLGYSMGVFESSPGNTFCYPVGDFRNTLINLSFAGANNVLVDRDYKKVVKYFERRNTVGNVKQMAGAVTAAAMKIVYLDSIRSAMILHAVHPPFLRILTATYDSFCEQLSKLSVVETEAIMWVVEDRTSPNTLLIDENSDPAVIAMIKTHLSIDADGKLVVQPAPSHDSLFTFAATGKFSSEVVHEEVKSLPYSKIPVMRWADWSDSGDEEDEVVRKQSVKQQHQEKINNPNHPDSNPIVSVNLNLPTLLKKDVISKSTTCTQRTKAKSIFREKLLKAYAARSAESKRNFLAHLEKIKAAKSRGGASRKKGGKFTFDHELDEMLDSFSQDGYSQYSEMSIEDEQAFLDSLDDQYYNPHQDYKDSYEDDDRKGRLSDEESFYSDQEHHSRDEKHHSGDGRHENHRKNGYGRR